MVHASCCFSIFVLVATVFNIFNFEKTEHGVGTLTELSGLIGTSRESLLFFFCFFLCFGSMPFYRRTMDMAVEVSGMQLSWGVEMPRENHLLSGERGSFRGF
ncbi:unnamed protein product [Malus baccata var. baccata]